MKKINTKNREGMQNADELLKWYYYVSIYYYYMGILYSHTTVKSSMSFVFTAATTSNCKTWQKRNSFLYSLIHKVRLRNTKRGKFIMYCIVY